MNKRAFWRSAMLCTGVTVCVLALAGWSGAQAQTAKHAITFDDMIQMHRVGEPQISPDGKWIAYTLATPDLDANRNASNIWIVATTGGAPADISISSTPRRSVAPAPSAASARVVHIAGWLIQNGPGTSGKTVDKSKANGSAASPGMFSS